MKWTRIHTWCVVALAPLTALWFAVCLNGLVGTLRHYGAMDSFWVNAPFALFVALVPAMFVWACVLFMASLLAGFRRKSGGASVTCPECGYDMRGLSGRACPECGQTARPRRGGQ